MGAEAGAGAPQAQSPAWGTAAARAGALLEILQVQIETSQSDSVACGTTEELLLFAFLLG